MKFPSRPPERPQTLPLCALSFLPSSNRPLFLSLPHSSWSLSAPWCLQFSRNSFSFTFFRTLGKKIGGGHLLFFFSDGCSLIADRLPSAKSNHLQSYAFPLISEPLTPFLATLSKKHRWDTPTVLPPLELPALAWPLSLLCYTFSHTRLPCLSSRTSAPSFVPRSASLFHSFSPRSAG